MHVTEQNDELMHYGVRGMRWGVRRASKQLERSTNSGTRDKAINALNKHKAKGESKVASLEKKRVKLNNDLHKATIHDKIRADKMESKAQKLDAKIAKNESKATAWYTSTNKVSKLMAKNTKLELRSNKLHTKASVLNSNYEKAKSKIEANESMQKAFKTELKNIDNALVENGRRYING